jgi:cytoskeletal protein CcmA (bactofilin family)
MTTPCPSPLVRSAYADGELPAADAAALEAHLDSCAACRVRIGALRRERAALRVLLGAVEPAAAPEFQRPLGNLGLAIAGLSALAVGAFASSAWDALAAAVPSGLRWLNPFASGSLVDLFVSLLLFINNEGIAMLTSIVQFSASAVLVALLAYACAAILKPRAGIAALLSVLLIVAAFPRFSHALEIRRSQGVTAVAAGETVDDTLLAIGETVSIDGDVNGDLLAFARLVTVRGNVSGDVISAGETVEIQGKVGGNVFGAGRAVTLTQSHVGRNFYGAGSDVGLGTGTEIVGNATAAGRTVNVDGKVGVDLTSFAEAVLLRGDVTRNVVALGQSVTVLAPATVGGDLVARVGDLDKVQVASGATVRGNVDKQVVEEMRERAKAGSKYLRPSFYVWQLVRLGAAFLSGLLLLWVFPGLQTASLADASAALKAGVFGLVAAIALPVIAIIACITVVGLPVGIIGAIVWLLGLYFAKTVVAQLIGRTLFRSPQGVPHYAATLLAGLVIVIVAINLPWIGWLIGLVLTLLGLGMLVNYVAERSGRTL